MPEGRLKARVFAYVDSIRNQEVVEKLNGIVDHSQLLCFDVVRPDAAEACPLDSPISSCGHVKMPLFLFVLVMEVTCAFFAGL